MKRIFQLLLIQALIANACFAQVILVDQGGGGDAVTVRQGIDMAGDGDTVLLNPDIYYETINFNGKNITICSRYVYENDPWYIHHTVIDGNNDGSVVTVEEGESNAVLTGITIQKGSGSEGYAYGRRGGGINCWYSTIKITHCIIKDNLVSKSGGGIYCWGGKLLLSGTSVCNNHALDLGGGIALIDTAEIFFDTVHRNNIYMNFASRGCDIHRSSLVIPFTVTVDTFSVLSPDHYFISSTDVNGNQLHNVDTDILHGMIETVNADLFVNPDGNNLNSGLTPLEPLQSLTYALSKIVPDSLNPHVIHLAGGIYSPSLTDEMFPLNCRSFISFEGESMEGTVLDGENEVWHFQCNPNERNIRFRKMKLMRGLGRVHLNYNSVIGSMDFYLNENIQLDSLLFTENEGYFAAALFIQYCPDIRISNSTFQTNHGSRTIQIYDASDVPQFYGIENVMMRNNTGGVIYPEETGGGGIALIGNRYYYHRMLVSLNNLNITNNFNNLNPSEYTGFCCDALDGAKISVINSTIGNNIALSSSKGAIVLGSNAEINLFSSILYNPDLTLEVITGSYEPGTTSRLGIYNSLIRDGDDHVYVNGPSVITWGNGILETNPLWIGEGMFPYALDEESPCIDAGVPFYTPGMEPPYMILHEGALSLCTPDGDTIALSSTDLAGNPRLSGDQVDMGAYEFQHGVFTSEQPPGPFQIPLQVYPNPFSGQTSISFKIEQPSEVILEICDVNGKNIKTLMDAKVSPGKYCIQWDGSSETGMKLKAGTYLIQLIANQHLVSSSKVVYNP